MEKPVFLLGVLEPYARDAILVEGEWKGGGWKGGERGRRGGGGEERRGIEGSQHANDSLTWVSVSVCVCRDQHCFDVQDN